MVRMMLVVAVLLLTGLTGAAEAADNPEHNSKNARKALIVLGAIGADTKEIRNFVENIDSRIENGYLTLAEEKIAGGTIKLHYELGSGVKLKRIELRFTPDDSNWVATARPDRVMINYTYKF